MKLKILFISILAFVLSGCYSSFRTTGYSYEQSDDVVYIDYNFECSHCYYEMYYCFNCSIFHVSINHWCNHHYNWYITWYSYNYHRPHGYYYRHFNQHRYYRDATRHYVRDRNGRRNHKDKKYVERKKLKDQRKIYKRKEVKEQRKIYKRNDVKKYKTQKRKIKQYKAPRKNVQKQKVRKQNTRKNTRKNVQKNTNKRRK